MGLWPGSHIFISNLLDDVRELINSASGLAGYRRVLAAYSTHFFCWGENV